MKEHYDTIIVGAGLSGLAAGIRLAHFEHDVAIVEAHSLCGGLNSWYRRKGHVIDVGLHAMTNYVPKGGKKGPLTKLLRQLRIPYDSLKLCPQLRSRIEFPESELEFTNDFEALQRSVEFNFPAENQNFRDFAKRVDDFDEVSLNPPILSAREEMANYLKDPLLIDMLLTPLMFYGNPDEHDMDFAQFAVMWKSIYCSGFARPADGMRPIIEMLINRFRDSGGTLLTNTAVSELILDEGHITSVSLEGGRNINCDAVLSCAGFNETMGLIPEMNPSTSLVRPGKLSFVEQVFLLDRPVNELGLTDSIVFFNHADMLAYCRPDDAVDFTNGVICCPENFEAVGNEMRHELRVTLRASYPEWKAIADRGKEHYLLAKDSVTEKITDILEREFMLSLSGHIQFSDLFTPLTIERFSRHSGGAVYGSPDKHRSGETGVKNLKVIGTDQGFLGIVGAMLSGITIANQTLNGFE